MPPLIHKTRIKPPATFTATTASSSQINLAWTSPGAGFNIAAYILERSPNGTDTWTQIYSGPLLGFSDTGLTSSTNYWYRISVIDYRGISSAYATIATAQTLASSTITLAILRALGYLIITDAPYNADPTFTTDSTVGIQRCIDDGTAQGRPVWAPTGTYMISAPLHFYRWQLWNTSTGAVNNPDLTAHTFQGAWNSGGARPIFKIKGGSVPIFDDVNNPAPMYGWRMYVAQNASGATLPNPVPANPMTLPANFTGPIGDIYYAAIKGIDFDTNGHAGAIGVHAISAQQCHMERVKVTATGSLACFSGLPHVGSAVVNIEGVGGQYGLKLDTNATQGANGSGLTITGLKLSGQTVQGIVTNDFVTLTITGLDVTLTGSAKFWNYAHTDSANARGTAAFIDGQISQAASIPFDNSDSGRSIYIRNLYVTGTSNLIKSGANATITGSGTWSLINEYSCCDQTAPATPYPANSTSFKTWNLFTSEGALSTTYEKATSITNNSGAPPSDIASRHYPAVFEQVDTGDFVTITDFGAVRVQGSNASDYLDVSNVYGKTGQTDCLAAFNAAIAAAHAAGHERVVVPFGAFLVSNTINALANTKIIMLGARSSSIGVHESWRPTTGNPVLLKWANDTEGSGFIGYGWLTVPEVSGTLSNNAWSGNRFNWVQWGAGRKSSSAHIYAIDEFETATLACPVGRIGWDITATGGGRHYGFRNGNNWTGCHKDSRAIRVKGTTQPTAFYGQNMELAKQSAVADNPDCGIEITNSSNVRFYTQKREGRCCTYIIDNSLNWALHGHGVAQVAVNSSNGCYIEVKATANNGLISVCNQQSEKGATSKLLKDGTTGLSIPMPENLALYKKGVIDDTLMVFTV